MNAPSFRSVRVGVAFALGLVLPLSIAATEIPEEVVLRTRRAVVNVVKSASHALNGEQAGRFYATGFLVDAEAGIIATNRHVAGTGPSQVLLTFENGESAQARTLHYDVAHDFAFYRFDPAAIEGPLTALELGDSRELREQDEVFMVGNNDAEEYSVKYGRVTNLVVDKGGRHTATFQTSFDRAGGSSGSPVVDAAGRVVGVHYRGTDTTSFEMRIDYVRDALRQLQAAGKVRRGEIGVQLDLMRLSDAVSHFRLPDSEAAKIRALRPDIKRAIYVEHVIPHSRSAGLLLPGDIVVEVGGVRVGDDLYAFDRIVDERVGDEVSLVVFRNGVRRQWRLPVDDAERTKITEFVVFAGGVVHDLGPDLRRQYDAEDEGVFLSQARPGSSMAQLGSGQRRNPSAYAVVIREFAGKPTPTLDAFVEAARGLSDGDDIYVLMRDLRRPSSATEADWLTLELGFSPLRTYRHDPESLEWRPVPLSDSPAVP